MGGMFLFSAAIKIAHREAGLQLSIDSTAWFDAVTAGLLARTLPFVEMVIGLYCLFAPRRFARLAPAVVALSFFQVAIVQIGLKTSWREPCKCMGGVLGGTALWEALVRNFVVLGLIALAVIVGPWLSREVSKAGDGSGA